MRKALLAASAILMAGGIAAHAQTTTTPGTSGTSMSNQCWDVSTNTVKQQAPGSSASGSGSSGSTAGTSAATPGSTTGAASSGGSASTATTTATTRPSGMQNC
jgi:hypothetical protein